jgi:hypothetical protein
MAVGKKSAGQTADYDCDKEGQMQCEFFQHERSPLSKDSLTSDRAPSRLPEAHASVRDDKQIRRASFAKGVEEEENRR